MGKLKKISDAAFTNMLLTAIGPCRAPPGKLPLVLPVRP